MDRQIREDDTTPWGSELDIVTEDISASKVAPSPNQDGEGNSARDESRVSQNGIKERSFRVKNLGQFRAYISESLVFQELQREFKGAIRRNVVLRPRGSHSSIEVDGIIETPNRKFLVEVKYIRDKLNIRKRLDEQLFKFRESCLVIPDLVDAKAGFIICLVFENDGDLKRDVIDLVNTSLADQPSAIDVRYYSIRELMRKYGFNLDLTDVPSAASAKP